MYNLHVMVRLLAVIKQKINGEVLCMVVKKSTMVICDRQTTEEEDKWGDHMALPSQCLCAIISGIVFKLR